MSPRYRAHPVTIIGNLWRVLYLIIIPVLRGFFAALQSDFAGWLSGAWLDTLILLLMVTLAVLRWRGVSYYWDGAALHIRAGVFFRTHTVIPWGKITTLALAQPFYLRPVRAVRIRADTIGGGKSNADFTVILSGKTARLMMEHAAEQCDTGENHADGRYAPRTGSVAALSLLNSNSPAGIVFIATFISQSGKLLGAEFSRMLLDTFEETTRSLASGRIPPAAAAIAYLLLGGWAVSFVLSFSRYMNMRITREDSFLRIAGGSVTPREYLVRYGDISFVDIRQSLVTKLTGLYSLYISAVGYGKHKQDMTCIIPVESKRDFDKSRELLFPSITPARRTLAANRGAIMRFVAFPLCFCAGVSLVTALVIRNIEGWSSFALFVGMMAMAPALFLLSVRILDYRTGGVARVSDVFTLRYSKGFYLHTVVTQADKIALVELRQGIFQRIGGSCDALVRTRGESGVIHRCRALNLEKARQMFDFHRGC